MDLRHGVPVADYGRGRTGIAAAANYTMSSTREVFVCAGVSGGHPHDLG